MKLLFKSIKQISRYNLKMIIIIAFLLTAFSVFIISKYYVKPKKQIKRYVNMFRSFGYTVYEQPFAFMGISFVKIFEQGLRDHKDVMYLEASVYPQVDIVIGNTLNDIALGFVHPELIKAFLTGNSPNIYPKYQLTARGVRAFFGNGVAFIEGDIWKTRRKLLSKTFNFQIVKANIPKIVQICNRALDRFESTHKVGENTYQYSPLQLSTRIFNNVMLKCLFGTDQIQGTFMGQSFDQFVNTTIRKASVLSTDPLVGLLGEYAWKFGLTPAVRQAKNRLNLLRQKSKQIVKKLTANILSQPKKEVCTYLLEALVYEKLDNKEQVSLTDQQLVDQFQGFLAAGTDTTAHFLNMMIYYLAHNPSKLNRLREEIDAVIKSDQDITYQNLKKLTYTDWCQHETTRMYGPGTGIMPRIASEDNQINELTISKGTVVGYHSKGNHYNPKYFKNPTQFRPERWESECNGIHPYALLGFSAGLRSCIGKQFAHLQSKIALIKIIKRYETIIAPQQVTLNVIFVYEAEPFDVAFTKKAAQQ